jgi:hypothetical protein
MLFGTKRITGIWTTSISFVLILICIMLSFAIDHFINQRIRVYRPDIKTKPVFWETPDQ